jgi:hypothetical protein
VRPLHPGCFCRGVPHASSGRALIKDPRVSTAGGGILPCSSRASALRLFPRPIARHSERSRPIFFIPLRSCEAVGLRREKSLFSLHSSRLSRPGRDRVPFPGFCSGRLPRRAPSLAAADSPRLCTVEFTSPSFFFCHPERSEGSALRFGLAASAVFASRTLRRGEP